MAETNSPCKIACLTNGAAWPAKPRRDTATGTSKQTTPAFAANPTRSGLTAESTALVIHHFRFAAFRHVAGGIFVLLGQFLDLLFERRALIFAQQLVLFFLIGGLVAVAADVAD